jgi:DNA polymerase-3 subunit delta'
VTGISGAPGTSSSDALEAGWAGVVGQPEAVSRLRAAAASPVHAYLFVGPHGSGKRAAARAFAAELLAAELTGADRERAVALALAGQHPDLVVVEPEGARISAPQARAIVNQAARSPVEGARQVLVLSEMHNIETVAPILLKAIEEPPPATVFVILADEVVPDLVTIASRCLRVPFGPIPETVIVDQLRTEGADAEQAGVAALAAQGDLDRARLLVGDEALGRRRQVWRSVPSRLDGSGSTVVALVDELRSLIDESQRHLDERHAEERREQDEREERYGVRGSGRRELVDRQKRQVRRHRTAELRFGLATMAGAYRDELASASARPRSLVEAIAAIQEAAEALIRNPNEPLLLQALLLRLPPPSGL